MYVEGKYIQVVLNNKIYFLVVLKLCITLAAMKTKDITPLQYAKWKGCTLQNITKLIRNNKELPGVITIKKYSRFYLLEVPENMTAATFEKICKAVA